MVSQRDEAKRLFDAGLSPSEIARRLSIPSGTVRGWKSKDGWSGTQKKRNAPERSGQKKSKTKSPPPPAKPPSGAELGEALSAEDIGFCERYIRNRNATMAYMQGHPGTPYGSASTLGYLLLKKIAIRAYVDYLLRLRAESVSFDPGDMVEYHMRVAFADLADFATWGFDGHDNQLAVMPSEMVDSTIVSEVSKSDKGFKIKLVDRHKSLDFLARYFMLNPMDKHKVDYELLRLEMAQADPQEGVADDGFMQALSGAVEEVWADDGDDSPTPSPDQGTQES